MYCIDVCKCHIFYSIIIWQVVSLTAFSIILISNQNNNFNGISSEKKQIQCYLLKDNF